MVISLDNEIDLGFCYPKYEGYAYVIICKHQLHLFIFKVPAQQEPIFV